VLLEDAVVPPKHNLALQKFWQEVAPYDRRAKDNTKV
jgi:hypothetical protein